MANVVDELSSVFSILPDENRRSAIAETIAQLGTDAFRSTEFTWADLRPDGSFLRGGLSNAQGQAKLAFSSPSEHAGLRLIMAATEVDCRPGTVVRPPERDCFVWFLPQIHAEPDRRPEQIVRAIIVTASVFDTVVQMFNAQAGLSGAERRVLFQLTAGLRVRDAADADGVGVETKRTQIKSATAKLMCGGQTEMVRTAIGQLFHLVSAADTAGAESRIAEDFVTRILPNDCRVMTLRLGNGRNLRLLEAGSSMGEPVVVMHGMLLPMMLMGQSEVFKSRNLRIIVPLKTGYLQPQTAGDLMDATGPHDVFELDVLSFASDLFPEPVPLIGVSLGAPAAIRIAARRPELFSRLHIISLHMPDRTGLGGSFSSKFHAGIRALSSSPGMLRTLTWQFRKQFANARTVRSSFQRVFEGSSSDLALLSGAHDGRPAHTWYPEFYRNSILGVAEDFRSAMTDWRSLLRDLPLAVSLIHGREDPLTTVSEVASLARELGDLPLTTLDGAGHIQYATHSEQVWDLITANRPG